MRRAILICSLALIVIWTVIRGLAEIRFERGCEGHLKRAADANTIELAIQETQTAVDYMEAQGLTAGYTSVIYTTPDEDIGFWHQNIKASLEELKSVSPEATPLVKSNVLLKLRETLLDHGQHGDTVTAPTGISVYPFNLPLALMLVAGFVGSLAFILAMRQGWWAPYRRQRRHY